MIVEQRIELPRSPATVYAFLVDQAAWARLDPSLLHITPRGRVTKGMAGVMTRRVSGLRVTNGWTVTDLDVDVRVGMRVTGPGYALTETTTLVATPTGCRATIVDTLEPTSPTGRLFVTVSGPFARRDLRARAGRLGACMEAFATAS